VIRPVVTVTLNPAIDRSVWVDELLPGTTHRTADTQATFGGKGINVARVVARIGAPVVAIGFAGEDQATPMEHHLESLGVRARFIRVPGETRTNLKIVEQKYERLTEINGSGLEVSPELVAALEDRLLEVIGQEGSTTVVFAGSLPLGVDASVYAGWIQLLRRASPDVRVLVDTSDEALASVVRARPFFLKPNRSEAEAITGREIKNSNDAVAAARQIVDAGPQAVLLSLGGGGAVAVWGDHADIIAATPLEVAPGQLQTTVGAGDAMVARVAVELSHFDGAVSSAQFFEISRRAVSEAESQINGAVPMVDA
jgi:1-phosphofructokinase